MTEQTQTEQHAFQAEVQQLLQLMIHSLYSNPEIFLRELISNASDAIDTARYLSMTTEGYRAHDGQPEIRLEVNADEKWLKVSDTGAGFTRAQLLENLGTIARSGTQAMLQRAVEAREAGASEAELELIGQFGVGFYSAFMVADRIEVDTRSGAPEEGPMLWTGTAGEASFGIAAGSREERGTTITLHLNEKGLEFAQDWRLQGLVKKYSDFVRHPIMLGEDQLNSGTAIWARTPSEVTDEEHTEFYRHVMGGWTSDEPLSRLHLRADAPVQFQSVLYIPGHPPADLFQEDRKGVQLYARRVFIMDNCEKLVPSWMRFLRGVVDSEDLPLNVSRELLQEDRNLTTIRKQLVRKLLKHLEALATNEPETFQTFWSHFGRVVKEGLYNDYENREKLTELVRFNAASHEDETGLTTLAAYVEGMTEDQPGIFYIAGSDRSTLLASPHLEQLRERGYDVLLMTDAVDEWALQGLRTYGDHKLLNAAEEGLELPEQEDADETPEEVRAAVDALVTDLKGRLEQRVADVRLSQRLSTSPACLVQKEGELSANMLRLLKDNEQEAPETKRILEVNPKNPFVRALAEASKADPESDQVASWSALLLDQALLAEGTVEDPAGVVGRIQGLLLAVADGASRGEAPSASA